MKRLSIGLLGSLNELAVANGLAPIDREEMNLSVLGILLNEFLYAGALTLCSALNIKNESHIGVQVVLTVYMVVPHNILDVESGLADSTYETLAFDFLFELVCLGSLVCEGVNDDTKENVHEDDVNYDEEAEIKHGS